ncbi:MAG: glycosyltransferase family 4 protein [Candidatus Riflebacteria bacterium]|nr:glycosyltransferase family 4 protein [Candidatus Riflebacteria bacterium]
MQGHRLYLVIARLNIGGPAVHVSLLASRLPAAYDPVLITGEVGPDEGDMTYYAREQGVEPLQLAGLGRELRFLADLRLLWRLYRIFRAERPAIVHTHTAKAGAVGRLAAWLAGVPVIVHTFHGHVLKGYFGPVKTGIFTWIERALARVTDCIITLGDHQRTEILSFGVGTPDRVVAVPLGMDLEPFFGARPRPGALQRRLGLPESATLVGIVARLVPIKRPHDFVEAARQLAGRRADVHFVIVGDGELREELLDRVRSLSIEQRVHFLGWEKDLTTVYPDLSCLALCSANEGLPTAIIEAQAAGVPVVATSVGSVPDMVEDGRTGHLIPVGEPGRLAESIEMVLNDPGGARTMGLAARSRARDRYGLHRLMTDMDRLYRSLLVRKGIET